MSDPESGTIVPSPGTAIVFPSGLTGGPLSASIQQAITDAMLDIPEEKRLVLLTMATKDGVKFTAATRLGDHWQVAGDVWKPWGGPIEGRVMVQGSW